jgi:UDP-N-acetylmuramate: L-alanyl-gamma-D-glutamyl-meso-diaminopimelate ligase
MRVHFIAIGGSAMHNLAIALHRKGYHVTGSDDEIFEPSKARLEKEGLLPSYKGWNDSMISENVDEIILGMHAREDNPELIKAKNLGIPIYSYPEYLYEQSKDKVRVVIGGSHGKTTITSMILHAVNSLQMDVDYMVGAQLEGYDCMVKLTEDAPIIILEGDEYLSSPIDRRPKFHLYRPNIALLSGISWDHVNVFPNYENYIEQFDIFCRLIQPDGTLVYNQEDEEVKRLGEKFTDSIHTVPYGSPEYKITETGTTLYFEKEKYDLKFFGEHNMQNLMGAMYVCQAIGIDPPNFLKVLTSFTGAGKRLQKVIESKNFTMYKDFAHSPSKLIATTRAVKEQFSERKVIACMELHTFSSLSKDFLPLYKGAMDKADEAVVYFNPAVVMHKNLEPLSIELVQEAFGGAVKVLTETDEVLDFIIRQDWNNSVLLMMSSGTFDGINYEALGKKIVEKLEMELP